MSGQEALVVGAHGTTVRQVAPGIGGQNRYCYICQRVGPHHPRDCPLRKDRQAARGFGGAVSESNNGSAVSGDNNGRAGGGVAIPAPHSQQQDQGMRTVPRGGGGAVGSAGAGGGNTRIGTRPNPNQPCFNCNQTGHFIRDCPNPPSENNATICFKCAQVGHFAKDCKMDEGKSAGEVKHLPCLVCKEYGHFAVNCPKGKQPQGMAHGFEEARPFTDSQLRTQEQNAAATLSAGTTVGGTTTTTTLSSSVTAPPNFLDPFSNGSATGGSVPSTPEQSATSVTALPVYGSTVQRQGPSTTYTGGSALGVGGGSGVEAYDSTNLIINYIPNEVTMASQLEDMFVQFGEVEKVKLPKRPWPAGQRGPPTAAAAAAMQHRGFGFVKFKEVASAERAIREMDGARLGNKFLRVSVAAGSKERATIVREAEAVEQAKEESELRAQGGAPPPPPPPPPSGGPGGGVKVVSITQQHQQQQPQGPVVATGANGEQQFLVPMSMVQGNSAQQPQQQQPQQQVVLQQPTTTAKSNGQPAAQIVQQVMIPGSNGQPSQLVTLPAGAQIVSAAGGPPQGAQQQVVMAHGSQAIVVDQQQQQQQQQVHQQPPPQQQQQPVLSAEQQQQLQLKKLLGNLSMDDDDEDDGGGLAAQLGVGANQYQKNAEGALHHQQQQQQQLVAPAVSTPKIVTDIEGALNGVFQSFRQGLPRTAGVVVPRAQLADAISKAVVDIHLGFAVESGLLSENQENGSYVIMPDV